MSKPCPYKGCLGPYAHSHPHLFEAPQIDKMEEEIAKREQKAVLDAYYEGISKERLIEFFEERNKRVYPGADGDN